MDTRRNHSRTEADCRSAESCGDTLRFRLVGANGRHHFKSVWFRGANGHRPDDLAEIVQMLEGRWLDEIDTEALKSVQCRSHHSRDCLQEVAEIVADMQEMLLPERRPRAGHVHSNGRAGALGRFPGREGAFSRVRQEGMASDSSQEQGGRPTGVS